MIERIFYIANRGLHFTAGILYLPFNIDSGIEPMHGDVVLASIEGGVTLKRLMKLRNRIWLEPDNKKYDPIMLNAEIENFICGVMLLSIRPVSLNHIKKF